MLYLLLAILSSTGIFVCFKYLERYKIDTFSAIIINYATATILGIALSGNSFSPTEIWHSEWLPISVLIGCLFIIMFFIIGLSSQKAGIAVTTLASKMSFIIPMLFSLLYYQEGVSWIKTTGFLLAVAAVILAIIKKGNKQKEKDKYFWLPLVLFVGAGVIDSLVKFSQDLYFTNGGTSEFSTVLFGIAFLSGILAQVFRGGSLHFLKESKVIVGGTILGLFNFGSLYFLIESLNHSGIDSSIVFSIINMGIVSLSLFAGVLLFRERLTFINILGIVLAFIAIFILTNLG